MIGKSDSLIILFNNFNKIFMKKYFTRGFSLAFVVGLFLIFGALTPTASVGAQATVVSRPPSISVCQLVDMLVLIGVIPAEKAVIAQTAMGCNIVSTSTQPRIISLSKDSALPGEIVNVYVSNIPQGMGQYYVDLHSTSVSGGGLNVSLSPDGGYMSFVVPGMLPAKTYTLGVSYGYGARAASINTIPFTILSSTEQTVSPGVSIVGTPTLELLYDTAQKESLLRGTVNVDVYASSTDVTIRNDFISTGLYDQNDKQVNANSTTAKVDNIQGGTTNGILTTISQGNSIRLTVVYTAKPSELFAGNYYVTLKSLFMPNTSDINSLVEVPVPSNKTNTKTIIGEVSPYITSASASQTSDGGVQVNISGVRLAGGPNTNNQTVYIDNVTPTNLTGGVVDMSGTSNIFILSSLSAGQHNLYVVDSVTGKSNTVWFNFVGSDVIFTPGCPLILTRDLTIGSTGADVTALQNFLGLTPTTGYFGNVLKTAVIAYQSAHGIFPADGVVGPMTRAFISKIDICVPPGTAPSITVLSPNGGETWKKETPQEIRWNDTRMFLTTHYYDVYLNENCVIESQSQGCVEQNQKYLIGSGVSGSSYNWQVNKQIGSYTISVCDYGQTAACGKSNSTFRIIGSDDGQFYPKLDLMDPQVSTTNSYSVKLNGVVDTLNSSVDNTWCSNSNIHRDLLQRDGPFEFTWGDGSVSCSWFPATHTYQAVPAQYNISVRVSNTNGLISKRDTNVSVSNPAILPSITVLSPNGGEQWQVGETHVINWKSQGANALNYNVQIGIIDTRYSTEGGSRREATIAYSIPNTGSYVWVIPKGVNSMDLTDTDQSVYKVVIHSWSDSDTGVALGDTSDSAFKIIASSPVTTNLPPVINGATAPVSLKVGETGSWSVQATDPENGPLTYGVDWGDTPVAPIKGTAFTASAQQNSTFTHSYSAPGTYKVVFTVSDNGGLTAQTSTTVQVNVVPVPVIVPACTGFKLSDWTTCTNNTQARKLLDYSPAGCDTSAFVLNRSCTVTSVVVPFSKSFSGGFGQIYDLGRLVDVNSISGNWVESSSVAGGCKGQIFAGADTASLRVVKDWTTVSGGFSVSNPGSIRYIKFWGYDACSSTVPSLNVTGTYKSDITTPNSASAISGWEGLLRLIQVLR